MCSFVALAGEIRLLEAEAGALGMTREELLRIREIADPTERREVLKRRVVCLQQAALRYLKGPAMHGA